MLSICSEQWVWFWFFIPTKIWFVVCLCPWWKFCIRCNTTSVWIHIFSMINVSQTSTNCPNEFWLRLLIQPNITTNAFEILINSFIKYCWCRLWAKPAFVYYGCIQNLFDIFALLCWPRGHIGQGYWDFHLAWHLPQVVPRAVGMVLCAPAYPFQLLTLF